MEQTKAELLDQIAILEEKLLKAYDIEQLEERFKKTPLFLQQETEIVMLKSENYIKDCEIRRLNRLIKHLTQKKEPL